MSDIFNLRETKKETLTSQFSTMAANLMHNHVLVVNKGNGDEKEYQIVEIEFYFSSDEDEIDLFRHKQCKENKKKSNAKKTKCKIIDSGLLRFHYSGIDISLKQEIDNKPYYGGILIRAIKDESNEVINGPLSVVTKLFSKMSLTKPFSITLKSITSKKNADKILSSYRVNLNPFPQKNLEKAIQHRFLPWRFISDKRVGNLYLTHGIQNKDYEYNANPYKESIKAGKAAKEPMNKKNLAGYFELLGYYQKKFKKP